MKQSISQIKNSLKKKSISVEELHDEFFKKAKLNSNNAYNLITDKAQNKSLINESQKRYDNSNSLPLDGIPLGIKDLFCSNGLPLGIQFIGNYFQEKKLLQLAALAEKELAFNE